MGTSFTDENTQVSLIFILNSGRIPADRNFRKLTLNNQIFEEKTNYILTIF